MRINTKQAVKRFYPTSSFDLIYLEAVANSLDANATEISISIKLNDSASLEGLSVIIWDNGVGLNNIRFNKFSSLLEVDETTHKGVGRLVFLNYFAKVDVSSVYENIKKRDFVFSYSFEGKSDVVDVEAQDTYTQLTMTEFVGVRIHNRTYLQPKDICKKLLEVFYMRFYLSKRNGRDIRIKVSLDIDTENIHQEEMLTTALIPNFLVKQSEYKRDLFSNMDLYYHIRKVDSQNEARLITALAVDDRTNNIDVIAQENIPPQYEMIFLLVSDSFKGKVDDSRQNLMLSDFDLQEIKREFRKGILEVLLEALPDFVKKREKKILYLQSCYPHLLGYFNNEDVCLSSQNDIVKKAQECFLSEQREVLGVVELTDQQYEKSLNISARVLAEYILFRQKTIDRLKKITPSEKESEIHNIIAPKRSRFEKESFVEDLYRNNVWILDDKFMTYRTILSEATMTQIMDVLTQGRSVTENLDRPDISLFFSEDPTNEEERFDVVMVELKRLGIGTERNSDIVVQLHERARALSTFYGNRLQRVWYYGVEDLDTQTRLDLRSLEFKPLFSKGTTYFKHTEVFVNEEPEIRVEADMYIMDDAAMVNDAEARNSTFMKILQHQIKVNSAANIDEGQKEGIKF